MADIRTIELGDREIIKDDSGEFTERVTNRVKYPCKLTNFILQYAVEHSILDNTSLSEIISKLSSDQILSLKIVYLGFLGANPKERDNITFEEFCDKLLIDIDEVWFTASSLINKELPDTFKEWIEELDKNTDTDVKKK